MKRTIISVILTIALVVSITGSAFAEDFGNFDEINMTENIVVNSSSTWSKPVTGIWNLGQVVGTYTLAVAIVSLGTGIGLTLGMKIAGIIANAVGYGAGNVWAKTSVCYREDSNYYYTKMTTSFYKDSKCKKKICGPYTITRKKSKNSGASLGDGTE